LVVIVGDSDEAVASAAGDGSCGTKPRAGATNAPPKQTAFVSFKCYHILMYQIVHLAGFSWFLGSFGFFFDRLGSEKS